jgi:hypothetical protein
VQAQGQLEVTSFGTLSLFLFCSNLLEPNVRSETRFSC